MLYVRIEFLECVCVGACVGVCVCVCCVCVCVCVHLVNTGSIFVCVCAVSVFLYVFVLCTEGSDRHISIEMTNHTHTNTHTHQVDETYERGKGREGGREGRSERERGEEREGERDTRALPHTHKPRNTYDVFSKKISLDRWGRVAVQCVQREYLSVLKRGYPPPFFSSTWSTGYSNTWRYVAVWCSVLQYVCV